MFQILLAKELREQRRTSRLWIVLAVFLVMGLISPLLAKYTPVLLRSIPDLPAGLADSIPEPTLRDALAQYLKNLSQFGVLLAILFNMGSLAQEKERGTAAMLLVKPVRRWAVVLTKWLAGSATIFGGVVLAALSFAFYTAVLFEPLPLYEFLALNMLLVVFLLVYLTVAILASAMARAQSMAAAGAFGGLILLLILSSLPRIGTYMPGQLLSWGESIVMNLNQTAWPSLAVILGLILIMLVVAIVFFEREEI